MIKKIVHLFLVVVFSISLFNCVATVRPRHAPPPPPRKIVKIHKPGPNYFWVPGHYEWRHGSYHWVSGHWAKKRAGMVWVSGHWVKRGGNWVYVKGHWRRK